MNRHHAATFLLAAATFIAGCGDRTDDDADTRPAPAAADDGSDMSGTATDGTIRITVSDGPASGNHEMTGETTCVHHAGTWIASFSAIGELESQAVLEGVPADGGSTSQVQFTAMIGDVMAEEDPGTMLMLAPGRSPDLNGTVTLRGSRGEVTVEGSSVEGTRITSRFSCSVVQR
jgi:hypothetical protein